MARTSGFLLLFGLSGCAIGGAPYYTLFGILGGIAARIGMVATGLSEQLPYQLFVCVSTGVIVAVAAWLVWFEQ